MKVSLIVTMTNGKLTLHKNRLYDVSDALGEALIRARAAVRGGFFEDLQPTEYYPPEMYPKKKEKALTPLTNEVNYE